MFLLQTILRGIVFNARASFAQMKTEAILKTFVQYMPDKVVTTTIRLSHKGIPFALYIDSDIVWGCFKAGKQSGTARMKCFACLLTLFEVASSGDRNIAPGSPTQKPH